MPRTEAGLLLVHAHPDDETLTTGGTIAHYAATGAKITVVTCTLGEEGEIIPPALDQLGSWASDQLGGYRAGELARAGEALGVREHRYLGGIGRWRDSGMAGTPSAEHPRAFVRGSLDEQAAQLRALLDELRPQVVVGYDGFGGYGHPDHIRAHQVTMAAVAGAEYVRRVFHTVAPATPVRRALDALRAVDGVPLRVPDDGELPVVDDSRAHTSVDVRDQLDAKLAALRAHATQVSVWDGPPACWGLSNGIAQPPLDAEYYELVFGLADGAETDLFGGL